MANETSVAVQNLCNEKTLSQAAFLGASVFLLDCANACNFSEGAPIAMPRRMASSYVYFIGPEHGPIKIGTAIDPYSRINNLQVGCVDHLYLYAMVEGDRHVERQFHSEFSRDRVRGEWFARTDRLLRRIILIQDQERSLVHIGPVRDGHPNTDPNHNAWRCE